jgi:hypothetical protein
MKVSTIEPAKGFKYSDAPQRSPEWIALRAPRLGASEIGAYMAKGVKGQYLAGRKDATQKVAYSKAFGVPFQGFVNGAMQAGIDNEDYMADQYSSQMGVELQKVGAFYNDWFVASPDRMIVGANAGVEIKWLFDKEFAELISKGLPKDEHYDQVQGQMWATGWDYVDYVAGNGNTGRFYVVRVYRDELRINDIKAEGDSVLAIQPMSTDNVFTLTGALPQVATNETVVWED